MVSLRVSAVLIRQDNEPEILVIRHRRRGRSHCVLPGGKVDDGETLEQAFVREVREETGLEVTMGALLFVADEIDPGRSRHGVNLIFHGLVVAGEFRASLQQSPSRIEWGDRAYYVPLARLDVEDFYPPIAGHVQSAYIGGFQDVTKYLGDVWREREDSANDIIEW